MSFYVNYNNFESKSTELLRDINCIFLLNCIRYVKNTFEMRTFFFKLAYRNTLTDIIIKHVIISMLITRCTSLHFRMTSISFQTAVSLFSQPTKECCLDSTALLLALSRRNVCTGFGFIIEKFGLTVTRNYLEVF